ncbi:hypothetical protein ABEO79_00230 [Micromonospora provocatoris]
MYIVIKKRQEFFTKEFSKGMMYQVVDSIKVGFGYSTNIYEIISTLLIVIILGLIILIYSKKKGLKKLGIIGLGVYFVSGLIFGLYIQILVCIIICYLINKRFKQK